MFEKVPDPSGELFSLSGGWINRVEILTRMVEPAPTHVYTPQALGLTIGGFFLNSLDLSRQMVRIGFGGLSCRTNEGGQYSLTKGLC